MLFWLIHLRSCSKENLHTYVSLHLPLLALSFPQLIIIFKVPLCQTHVTAHSNFKQGFRDGNRIRRDPINFNELTRRARIVKKKARARFSQVRCTHAPIFPFVRARRERRPPPSVSLGVLGRSNKVSVRARGKLIWLMFSGRGVIMGGNQWRLFFIIGVMELGDDGVSGGCALINIDDFDYYLCHSSGFLPTLTNKMHDKILFSAHAGVNWMRIAYE